MDKYASLRELPFPALATVLGFSLERFKHQKQDWAGPCPIHQSKNNVGCFRYHESGKFHCFSCEAKGRGGLDLAMRIRSIGFKAAVALLQAYSPTPELAKEKEPPVDAPGASRLTIGNSEIDNQPTPLTKDTWKKFAVPCAWLEQRIPDAAMRERYGVFCYSNPARKSAYSGRVMIPIEDVQGVLFGYLGRNTDTQDHTSAKYLFPKNLPKSHFLFGAHELSVQQKQPLPLKRVFLVESPFCVMKFASLGLPAVSPFGWSVSPEQIAILKQLCRGVVFLPDNNKRVEAISTLNKLAEVLWIHYPLFPEDDPEQLDREAILAL